MSRYYLSSSYFNLNQIANSGQCFRWYQDKDNKLWKFYIRQQPATAWEENNKIVISTRVPKFAVYQYFDMSTDYAKIIDLIPENDLYLRQAADMFSGIRILQQDLWEVIISFIISQNSSIPRIKSIIKAMCDDNDDIFPFPKDLLKMNLSKYHLGYRQKYIENFLRAYEYCFIVMNSNYKDDYNYYTRFKGIGPKVANCICLYGLHHLEACPIDTWMKRIIDTRYNGNVPSWVNSKYAGVYQQYCFCYERYLSGKDK